ncbi:MAG: PKD-like domain-containing protein, partial [Flavobacteriales bacterium]
MYSGTTATGSPLQTGAGSPINNPIPNNTCTEAPYTYQIIPTLNGCTGTPLTYTVNVRPKPVPSFTISPNPICVGQTATITYTGTACPTSTYTWQGLTAAGLTVTGSGIGPYTVTATAAGTFPIRVQSAIYSGCLSPFSPYTDLVVSPNPTATITGPTSVCSGNATALNLTSNPAGATFSWTQTPTNASGSSNGSGTSIAQTLTNTGTTAGTVQYSVTPSLNGCTGPTVNSTVTVQVIPTASTNTSSLCAGTSAAFSVTATPGASLSYTTSSGGSGVIPTGPGVTNFLSPGSFVLGGSWPAGVTITLTQISLLGCTTPLNIVITVTSSPTATVSTVSPICSGTTSALTFTGTPSALVTYNLGGGNLQVNLGPTGTNTVNSPVLTANTTVTITQVQISGGCSQALNNTATIVVSPANTAGAPSSNPTLCVNTAIIPITIATTGATGI